MADRFDDWSVTANSNTTVDSISIAEQMAPSNVNNAMRAIMASAALSFGGFPEGSARPSIVAARSFWLDTTSSTAPIIKFYDGADDITFATFDLTANTVSFSQAALAATSVTVADSGGYFDGSDAETVLADIGANYAKLAGPAFTGSVSMAGELQLDGVVQVPSQVIASNSSIALSMTGNNKKTIALATNTTITVSGEVADQVVEVWITQTSGGGTAAWSGVNKWVGGSAPTLSTTTGQIDLIILSSASDGSTIIGQHIGVAS